MFVRNGLTWSRPIVVPLFSRGGRPSSIKGQNQQGSRSQVAFGSVASGRPWGRAVAAAHFPHATFFHVKGDKAIDKVRQNKNALCNAPKPEEYMEDTRLSSSVHACSGRETCHTSNNATEQSRPQAKHIVHWRSPTHRSKSPSGNTSNRAETSAGSTACSRICATSQQW